MKQSRRQQHLIHENQKRLKWIGLIAGISLLIIIFFGAKIIIGFSLLIQGDDQSEKNDSSLAEELLSPPIIDEPLNATNEAKLVLTGSALENSTIVLYNNGTKETTTSVKKDGSFSVSITLEKGENVLKAKIKNSSNKESSFSSESSIAYDTTAPVLSIDIPKNGETYHKDSNPLKIRGKTDSNSTVKVNNLSAIVSSNGEFLSNFFMQNGENSVIIESIDEAGNTTKEEIKFNYSE